MTIQNDNEEPVKVLCTEITKDFVPKITTVSYKGRMENTEMLDVFLEKHNSDVNAHKGLITDLADKDAAQDVEISKKANKLELSAVATSGSYEDLSNKPTIPSAQVNSDWNSESGVSQILNKPTLSAVATSGSYSDLSNKPSIPTKTSDLTNDSSYLTSGDFDINPHSLKGYLDEGELMADGQGLADVTKYAHSTFYVNKFQKTGSGITITADGIASGFDGTSDLLTDYDFNPSTVWKIKCAFTTPASLSGCTIFTTTTTYGNRLQIIDGYLKLRLSPDNASYDIADATGTTQLSANTKYYVELIFDGSKYEVKLSTDNQNWTTDITVNSSTSIYTISTTQIRLGKASDVWEIFTGSIDLKEFYIVENGVITFRGNQTGTDTYTINGSTVSIPYTLSKTGSKIVDSTYRSSVSAIYSEFGLAPYYTLNEGVNFTVPQGEVYGMIENSNKFIYAPAVIDTSKSGAREIDISNLLPDDGYKYECIFCSRAVRTSTSTDSGAQLWVNMLEDDMYHRQSGLTIHIRKSEDDNFDVGDDHYFTGIIGTDRHIRVSIAHVTTDLFRHMTSLEYYRRISSGSRISSGN